VVGGVAPLGSLRGEPPREEAAKASAADGPKEEEARAIRASCSMERAFGQQDKPKPIMPAKKRRMKARIIASEACPAVPPKDGAGAEPVMAALKEEAWC